jgi:hypothetical protein
MAYIKITNGTQEPYSIGNLRRDNPNTSFSKAVNAETLASYGVHTVVVADTPTYDKDSQVISRNVVATNIGGQWTYEHTVRDKTAAELTAELSSKRAGMSCSKMQGILTLGETAWGEVQTYRETASWAEQMVIDSAQDWNRTSQNIAFFGYLLNYTDAQMDAMFIAAAQVTA